MALCRIRADSATSRPGRLCPCRFARSRLLFDPADGGKPSHPTNTSKLGFTRNITQECASPSVHCEQTVPATPQSGRERSGKPLAGDPQGLRPDPRSFDVVAALLLGKSDRTLSR